MGHKPIVNSEIHSKKMLRWIFEYIRQYNHFLFVLYVIIIEKLYFWCFDLHVKKKKLFQRTFYIILNTGGISLDTTEIEIDLKLKTWVAT